MIEFQHQIPNWAEVVSYKKIGYRGHYIDNHCILTKDHILKTRKIYLLVSLSGATIFNVQRIYLLDVYNINGLVHLFTIDEQSDKAMIVSIPVSQGKRDCSNVICDQESYSRLEELIDINKYCNCTGDFHK